MTEQKDDLLRRVLSFFAVSGGRAVRNMHLDPIFESYTRVEVEEMRRSALGAGLITRSEDKNTSGSVYITTQIGYEFLEGTLHEREDQGPYQDL